MSDYTLCKDCRKRRITWEEAAEHGGLCFHCQWDGKRIFTLRYSLDDGSRLTIDAYDTGVMDNRGTTRITIRAVHHIGKDRRVIWRPGETWCHPGPGDCDDSDKAKELVTSLVTIRPGDTDADYFEGYSPEQLEFCERYGEVLQMIAWERYGEP
jgi:hypothetical protein